MKTATTTTTTDRWTLAGLVFLLSAVAAPASAAQDDREATPEPEVERSPAPLILDITDMDEARLVDELRLRTVDRPISTGRPSPSPAIDPVYVVVRREDEQLHLSLILPNGDAHDRTTPDIAGQSERVVASLVAHLLDSIAAGGVEPTRTQVAAPTAASEEPEATSSPDPPPPVVEAPPQRPPPPEARAEPRIELAPVLAPAVLLSLAPRPNAGVLAGGGGHLGLDLRHVSGALVALDVRALGLVREPLALARLRIGVGAGYAWRRGGFELPVVLAVTIEPWWLVRDGAAPPLRRDGADVARRPAWGAAARLAPGFRFVPRRPAAPSFRIGARLELAGSFVADAGARTVRIALAEPDGIRRDRVQLGGLELGLGLEAALWFGATGRGRAARR